VVELKVRKSYATGKHSCLIIGKETIACSNGIAKKAENIMKAVLLILNI
jgi:hypothetical protein